MTQSNCIRHDFKLVNNHYDDKSNPDTESFSTGEWRTEKVCKCGYVLEVPEFYKLKIKYEKPILQN